MFIILSGSAKVYITTANGSKVVVSQLKAGDIFGEMSLLEGLCRSATVQALEDMTTVAVDESNFENVIRQDPSLALRIMKSLSERIRRQNCQLAKYKNKSSDISPTLEVSPPKVKVEIKEELKFDNTNEFNEILNILKSAGKYDNVVPSAGDSAYLYEKNILCPVCGQANDFKLIRSSKIKLKQVEPDSRRVYTDFEPLWYIVWVCPYCYYANFSADFPNLSDREQKLIRKLSSQVKDSFGTLPNQLSLTQVFTGYYLTLFWFQQMPSKDFEKLGKLWLRLSWLYQDVQESDISAMAAEKALESFIKHMESITAKTTKAADQYFYLLIGELSLKIGNIDQARYYFRQSIVTNGGNMRMKQQAQDRIQELRSLI